VWEKVAEKVKKIGLTITGIKKSISTWGKGVGLEHQNNTQMGGSGEYPWFYTLANGIVGKGVAKKLGLDECKFGFTGAAPISKDTLEYFGSLGLNVNEVYGMSECTGAVTFSCDAAHVWGSCGYALPGCEIKIFREDGSEAPLAKDMFNPTEDLDLTPLRMASLAKALPRSWGLTNASLASLARPLYLRILLSTLDLWV
jgi:hypothetical protein